MLTRRQAINQIHQKDLRSVNAVGLEKISAYRFAVNCRIIQQKLTELGMPLVSFAVDEDYQVVCMQATQSAYLIEFFKNKEFVPRLNQFTYATSQLTII